MNVRMLAAVLACAAALPASGLAADSTWQVDPVHSSATFTVTHLGISHVNGTIPIQRATIATAEGSNAPTNITAVLNPAGLDTKNSSRDDDLRSSHFFDVATYPQMSFQSTKIAQVDATHFTVDGNLTMHGTTKPVTLAVAFLGKMEDDRHRTHAGYEAKTTIDRTQWGMTYGNPFAGNSVDIVIDAEGVKP